MRCSHANCLHPHSLFVLEQHICLLLLLPLILQHSVMHGELRYEQQQAAIWQQLMQQLPQPLMVTAYMAQRDYQIVPTV